MRTCCDDYCSGSTAQLAWPGALLLPFQQLLYMLGHTYVCILLQQAAGVNKVVAQPPGVAQHLHKTRQHWANQPSAHVVSVW